MKLPSVSLRATLFAMIAAVVVPLAVLLPLAGWYVAAGLPRPETLAPIYRAMQLALAFAALVVLSAVALAWVVARRLSQPVAGIVAAMQRAASGATDAAAPETGPREIALISAEFNRMIAARRRLESDRHDALARAEAHERRLREIIDTIAEGVLIMGPDGRYELANRAEEVLLGVPRDRIIGVRFDAVSWGRAAADGSAFDLADHPFERLRRGERTVRDQVFQVVTPQGRARMVSVNAAALRDAAGGFDGIVMTGVDITERKTAEQRLRDVIETMTETITILDAEGRFEITNRAMERVLGTPRERIIGRSFDRVPWGRLAGDGSRLRDEDYPFERLRRGEPGIRDLELQVVPPGGGAPRLISFNAVPLRDAAGNFDGAVITGVDITERRSAERRLVDLIETLGEGLMLIGADGRYQLTNRAQEELLGVSRDRIIGVRFDEVPWGRLSADGSPFRVENHPFARLARGEPALRDYEMQFVTPQGQARTVLASAMPLHDAAGKFDGAVLSAVDITERKSAERRLRDIIETMTEGLFLIDRDGRYEVVNRAAEEILGMPRERIIGLRYDRAPWTRLAADGSPYRLEDHSFEQLRRGQTGVRDREIQFVPPDARPRMVSVNAMPLRDAAGRFDGIVATWVDITDRKSAERRLRETIETMAEGLAIVGPDGRYELFNRAAEELIGFPRERVLGVRFDEAPWTRLAADGTPFRAADHPFERLRRGEPPLRDYEYRVVTAQGAVRTISTNAAALHDAAHSFDGAVATWTDVTERKNAEQRLRDIIETMAEAVMIIGADGNYELVNREAELLLNRPRQRIVGFRQGDMPWARLAVDGRPLPVEELPLERLRRGESALHGYELQLVLPGGVSRTILLNAGPLRDAAGKFTGVVLSGFDITERKAAERRLAEYSARLGTLSRRVLAVQEDERRAVARELHDELGQVLTAVRLNLQTLRRRAAQPQLGAVFEDSLMLLESAIAEVRALSTRLRPTILDDLGLEAALRSHLQRSSVRAELELDADIRLPQRRLDPAVETACFRIVQEAMTNAMRHAAASRLAVALRVVNGELVLSVRDDGQGFDLAAAAARAARGESAGLSGMEERAQLAGGRLEMDTAPGQGTEVRALFPLAEEPR